ncbi:thymidine kinase [Vibrio parahaemolyticus]|uniref:thymidine kinase n=1 Tax=Vibrio parahaemolyticus TaxID=670 RepID=UPI00099724D5|nr:thymidine kinase [Vibrio parahaemolyticus]EGR5853925.1 thymidine kinase [Vibrio parahaemolyticus]ELA8198595.1 thymidine kinase [Vibrio parahaemolyticus]OOX46843.1 thymidine kinase [Vibrio parahaemolyticus]
MSLYFNYSSMNAGKSTSLLQASYNYNERGMGTILMTPMVDDRSGVGVIGSRIGLKADAHAVKPNDNLFEKVKEIIKAQESELPVRAVFVDEAQFLSESQVDQLSDIADELGLAVLAYGLRTDSFGELFPGSKRLLALADKIREVKTICKCGKKATFVVRYDSEGNPVKSGSQVDIGGNDKYVSFCRKHWKEEMRK